MNEAKRAVGYCRVSTDEQAEKGWSIDDQADRIREKAEAEGWDLVDLISDPGRQGDDPNRPGLLRVLGMLDQVDVIVVSAMDRLTRDLLLYAQIAKAVTKASVEIEPLTGAIDLATPEGEAMAGVQAVFGQFEKKKIAQRVKAAMTARARNGEWHGGPAPFGYQYAPPPGHGLVEHESESAIVQRIFAEWIGGKTQRQIVRDLNDDGCTCQRGGRWYQGTVSTLLKNPVYAGNVHVNGQTYAGRHEAIIDADTWRQACQLAAGPKASKRAKANHLLAGGLLRCGRCGSAMLAITKPTRTPGVLYERYVCSNRVENGVKACAMPLLQRALIDGTVWSFFEKVALDVESTRATMSVQHDTKLAEIDVLHAQALNEAMRARDRLARVRRDYADGKLDADDWRSFRDELHGELEAAEGKADRLEHQRAAVLDEREAFDIETAIFEELTRLRAEVVGEAQASGGNGVDALRTTLRRLFTFELLDEGRPFGAGLPGDDGETVVAPHADLLMAATDDRPWMLLLPRVRTDAITDWWDDETDFPALRRAALNLSGSDGNSLATKSSAPASNARTRSTSPQRPLSTSTARSGSIRLTAPSAARTRRTTSSPERSPRPTSRIARSGNLVSSRRRASAALSATRRS